MRTGNAIKRDAVRQAFKIIMQRVIGFALFAAAAGTVTDLRGNIYFLAYFLSAVAACAIMLRGHQEVLSAREKRRENTETWDKFLMPILVLLLFFGIYVAAGFGVRFGLARLSDAWSYVGYGFCVLSCVFSLWPLLENRHFEGTARIQSDREHTVVSTGPYRIVRHPGYLGCVLGTIAVTLIFGTWPVAVTAAVIIVLVVARTYLEDTMLKKDLAGYLAYADKVKYRLLPFLW